MRVTIVNCHFIVRDALERRQSRRLANQLYLILHYHIQW